MFSFIIDVFRACARGARPALLLACRVGPSRAAPVGAAVALRVRRFANPVPPVKMWLVPAGSAKKGWTACATPARRGAALRADQHGAAAWSICRDASPPAAERRLLRVAPRVVCVSSRLASSFAARPHLLQEATFLRQPARP